MLVPGIDPHKRTHTVVAIDSTGCKLGEKVTTATTTADHLDMLRWAEQFGPERRWTVEDCRRLSRRLERDLLAAGEAIVRVPPKMMANTRTRARTYGKSDPFDALAVARAALQEPDLPAAHLDGPTREVRLLVDHRDNLVAEQRQVDVQIAVASPRVGPGLGSAVADVEPLQAHRRSHRPPRQLRRPRRRVSRSSRLSPSAT